MDGAALLAAAVRAAVQAKAPRRTVQAVAAAVTGVLLRQPSAAVPHTDSRRRPDAPMETEDTGDPAQLLATLRASRRSQRQRKKERRRAAKQAAQVEPASLTHRHQLDGATATEGAAGPRAEPEGAPAAVPALAPASPDRSTPPGLTGLALQTLFAAPAAFSPAGGSRSSVPDSSVPSTLRPSPPASETASAGMSRLRSAPYSHTQTNAGRR